MYFTVNNKEWQLLFVEPTNTMLIRSDKVFTLGVTDNNYQTVFINNRLKGKLLDKVVCHELVHVFSFSYDMDIPIDTEEIVADFLATYGRNVFDVADDLLRKIMRLVV